MCSVSILIPCYNAERWIAHAIQSALDQTQVDKEVIVVDDGSSDGSLEVIQSFGDLIRWETGPNCGGNSARNRLLELSQGEWLQYLDADDYLLPNKVSQQLAESHDEQADVLWSPSIIEHWTADAPPIQEQQNLMDEDPWIALTRWHLPQTGASLWRRIAIESVGGWKVDQPCCQEHELYFRLLKSNAKFKFCRSALSVYRQWSSETVCRRDPLLTYRMRLEIIRSAADFLSQAGMFLQDRRQAIFAAMLQCARATYGQDREFATQVAAEAKATRGSVSLPAEPWFPITYRILYTLFGFRLAEGMATQARKFRRSLPSKTVGNSMGDQG